MGKKTKVCCGTCKHWDRDYVLKKRNGKPADYSPSPCHHPLVALPAMPLWQEKIITISPLADNYTCGNEGEGCKVWEAA